MIAPIKSRIPVAGRGSIYHLKITLAEVKPPIWRRIRVPGEANLGWLHAVIQVAMGWTNSHLHHFRIGEQLYGDPLLMQENFEELEYEDSTGTKISDMLPSNGKRFRFEYEYDFGDGWRHEILFEGPVGAKPGQGYPVCVEGARACPPEDVGGAWGYADFVKAIGDPHNKEHAELLQWAGGAFDPEAFDATKATKAMQRGLPNWRAEQWM